MSLNATAMPSAIFMPFGPPKASPTTISINVKAVKRNAVRKTFMAVSPEVSLEAVPSRRHSSKLDSGCRGRLLFSFTGSRAVKSHGVLVSIAVYADVVPRQHSAFEYLHRQRILNKALNGTPKRARA